ncbi:MAG: lytic transglycosylase domain-containing protein [Chitinophagaceae bacterium]
MIKKTPSLKFKFSSFVGVRGGFYAFFLLIYLFFSYISFSQTTPNPIPQKGFKSLFNNNAYDSTKSYQAQLNPRAISFVQEYIRKQSKELERMKQWGKPYFNMYDNILRQYNIPVEMKYLSVIESHLQSNLVSWAGAVGPWQIMDYEAKRFGLKIGNGIDERTDFVKSTHVACKLMKELYAEFGDWLLVVAAYNGGAGRVRGAIRKSGSREFWDLQYHVLEETRNHVKKFIATHYIFEGGAGLTTNTASENKKMFLEQQNKAAQPKTVDSSYTSIEIMGRYNAVLLCNTLQINIANFNELNPNFEKQLAEGKPYNMFILKDKLPLFIQKKQEILQQSFMALMK